MHDEILQEERSKRRTNQPFILPTWPIQKGADEIRTLVARLTPHPALSPLGEREAPVIARPLHRFTRDVSRVSLSPNGERGGVRGEAARLISSSIVLFLNPP